METNEILEGNRIIAEFCGYRVYNKRYPRNHGIGAPEKEWKDCILEKLKYHSSWDWLMPVCNKIENNMPWKYSVETYRNLYGGINYQCVIHDAGNATYIDVEDEDKINAVWLAVVDFIKYRRVHV